MRATEVEYLLELIKPLLNKYSKKGLEQLRVKKAILMLETEIWRIKKNRLSADIFKNHRKGLKAKRLRWV